MRLGVDEGHHVVLVAHGDGLAVRTPADVDVLALKQTGRLFAPELILALTDGAGPLAEPNHLNNQETSSRNMI